MSEVDRGQAETWASWFRALGDPTRVVLLHTLATADRPFTVGELVETVDVGQSTVSHHLKQLAAVGFVRLRREANTTWCEVNSRCISGFPSAAEIIMGRVAADVTLEEVCRG